MAYSKHCLKWDFQVPIRVKPFQFFADFRAQMLGRTVLLWFTEGGVVALLVSDSEGRLLAATVLGAYILVASACCIIVLINTSRHSSRTQYVLSHQLILLAMDAVFNARSRTIYSLDNCTCTVATANNSNYICLDAGNVSEQFCLYVQTIQSVDLIFCIWTITDVLVKGNLTPSNGHN